MGCVNDCKDGCCNDCVSDCNDCNGRTEADCCCNDACNAPCGFSRKAVADFAESRQPGYPLDKGGSGGGKKVNRESIESIKDPAKRIMARAAHMDLYK